MPSFRVRNIISHPVKHMDMGLKTNTSHFFNLPLPISAMKKHLPDKGIQWKVLVKGQDRRQLSRSLNKVDIHVDSWEQRTQEKEK